MKEICSDFSDLLGRIRIRHVIHVEMVVKPSRYGRLVQTLDILFFEKFP